MNSKDALDAKSWPLTQRQLLIWTGNALAPDIPANNILMTFAIDGQIDFRRFVKAFSIMLDETDILRTTFFASENGTPRQKVNNSINFDIDLIDFSCSKNAKEEIETWISAETIKPFDLSTICFSSALLKKSENQHIWFLCQHHIVTDGWATKIIYDRVRKAYRDSPSEPHTSVYSYNDYLRHMQKYAASDGYKDDQLYWSRKLETPIEPLSLYSQKHTPSSQTNRVSIDLGPHRSQALKTISDKIATISADMAIFNIFTTILFAYLHLVSGNNRLGLGVPMHNRLPKFKDTAGPMMEVAPLIIDFDEDETFDSLIKKITQEAFECFSHARYCVQNPAHSRIFDVSFNYQNQKYKDFAGTKVKSTYETALHRMPEKSKHKNTLAAGESLTIIISDFSNQNNYSINFDFNAGVFDQTTQDFAVQHFLKLTDAFISHQHASLKTINLLSDKESQHLLTSLNQTHAPSSQVSVIEMLEQHALKQPQKIAVVYHDTQLNYYALNQQVNRLAHGLTALGIEPETIISVYMGRSLELLITLLAIMKSGGAYLPLDPQHPADRIELILNDAQPRFLLIEDNAEYSFKLGSTTQMVSYSEIYEHVDLNDNLNLEFDENRLAYAIFTSGSTGRPKGVEISHYALNNFLHSMQKSPGMTADDWLVSVTTISFDIAALEFFLPILAGATLEIASQECTLDPSILKEKLNKATVLQATPTTFRMLIQAGWKGDKDIRLLCGGEAFPRDLADQLIQRSNSVWNMYGPTETTIWSTIDKVEEGSIVPIGTPIDNTQVYVLNAELVPVPSGCIGELYIAGSGLARGYYQRPDLTNAVFIANPFSKDSSTLMYRTGDLARFLPNNKLECLGRVDFQTKIRGFRIELGEIETQLGKHPAVDQNVVIVQEINNQKYLVAYVALNTTIDNFKLRNHLREKLPTYMVPSHIVVLKELPLTSNGKIDRKQLPESIVEDTSAPENHIEASSELEQRIKSIWRKALGVSRLSISDSFFDIGGHSLLALEVINSINNSCDADLSLSAIFEMPTIRQLALLIEGKLIDKEEGEASITTLKKGGDGIPLFCICGIYLYQNLANNLQTDEPVYGVFLPQETEMWMDSTKEELPTIQELAAYYIEAIKQTQPKGPYCLAGISFGGVLAFEIAQQLKNKGEQIKNLTLLDPVLPRAMKINYGALLKIYINKLQNEGVRNITVLLFQKVFGKSTPKNIIQNDDPTTRHEKPNSDMVAHRRQFYMDAISAYDQDAKPYSGSALLFCSELSDADFAGRKIMPCRGWSTLIDSLEMHTIKGGHLAILEEPNVNNIATIMEEHI